MTDYDRIDFDDEIVDIEQFAREGRPPPRCTRYRIRINREHFVVHKPYLTGRELLQLAGKCPLECYQILQHLCGGRIQQIGLDEKADLTLPGIERFRVEPTFVLCIEGNEIPWSRPTITTEEIIRVGGWDPKLGAQVIDLMTNEARTLKPGEEVKLEPCKAFAKKIGFRRG